MQSDVDPHMLKFLNDTESDVEVLTNLKSRAGVHCRSVNSRKHYSDVLMSAMASQITSVSIVYSTVCSGADQRKHQSSASVAF